MLRSQERIGQMATIDGGRGVTAVVLCPSFGAPAGSRKEALGRRDIARDVNIPIKWKEDLVMAVPESPKRRPPFIIGVAGGTASGKSSVCKKLLEMLGDDCDRVKTISQDSFYRNLAPEEIERAKEGDFNFDHPHAFEHTLLMSVLGDLCEGKSVRIPKYDFVTNSRLEDDHEEVQPVDVIIVEGILVLYDDQLRNMFNMKIFVDEDSDIRLSRRVERDTTERGRELKHILHQYLKLVKPAFEEFCLPTKKYADIVLPRGVENKVALALIVQNIQDVLRGSPHFFSSTYVESARFESSATHGVIMKDDEEKKKPSVKKLSRPH
uniref:uridine/cytidine kinase n=1 Tax=Steinernema glaseri TaxID=37863 RepID=A0A1I7ZZA5_9BILA